MPVSNDADRGSCRGSQSFSPGRHSYLSVLHTAPGRRTDCRPLEHCANGHAVGCRGPRSGRESLGAVHLEHTNNEHLFVNRGGKYGGGMVIIEKPSTFPRSGGSWNCSRGQTTWTAREPRGRGGGAGPAPARQPHTAPAS